MSPCLFARAASGCSAEDFELGGSLQAPQGAPQSGIFESSAYFTCYCFGTVREYRRSSSRGLIRIVLGLDDPERRVFGSEDEARTEERCNRSKGTRL